VKIVVGGASGFIGSALVPALRADGHEVLKLVRREPGGTDEIRWDPASSALDPASLEGVDAVIGLSGENIGRRWTDARKRAILESRVSATSLLARVAAALEPHPSVFLCASAVGGYGDRGDEILTEDSGLGTGFLPDVVRAWEAAAEPAREAGIRVVNFRQGIVLSDLLPRVMRPFKLGLGGRVGSGKQWWSWVALPDLVAGYRRALGTELGGVVNLTAPNPMTNDQFTKALGHALNRPTILPLPAFAARAAFGQMGQEILLEGQRVLPARLLEEGFEFTAPTIEVGIAQALSD
jgi:uncharacterized protein (TIGR01777 family)